MQHLIYVSRIGADPLSIHPLLKTKGICERKIKKSGIPFTILRSASLFGYEDRYFELLLGLVIWSWPFVWLPGGGQLVVQPLWVEDLALALERLVERPDLVNKTIVLAGEERLQYQDLMRMLLRLTGRRRIPLPIPLVLLRPFSRFFFHWWYWPAVSPFFVDRFFVPELAPLDNMLRTFGFRPTRLNEVITYLNRPGLRWRMFRH